MNSKPVALITGASGGIGEQIARELAARYHLVLVARSADKLSALASSLESAEIVALDLSRSDAVDTLTRTLQERGLEVSVLVNNAGFADYGEFWQADAGKLLEMVNLNVVTLTMLTRALLPGMVARKQGKIMNVASTAAFMPGPLMSVYYASKAYVLSFSEGLSAELEGTGVSVTALCPGPVETGFQSRAAMEGSKLLNNPMNPTMDSATVAKAAVSALEARQRVVIPGFMNQMLAVLPRFLPRALVPGIVKNAQARAH
jgi:short-subunit dehydrogenase